MRPKKANKHTNEQCTILRISDSASAYIDHKAWTMNIPAPLLVVDPLRIQTGRRFFVRIFLKGSLRLFHQAILHPPGIGRESSDSHCPGTTPRRAHLPVPLLAAMPLPFLPTSAHVSERQSAALHSEGYHQASCKRVDACNALVVPCDSVPSTG
jgi:hypothetical protein